MSNYKIGWLTTSKTKPIMIDALEEALRKGVVKIADDALINELTVYAYDDSGSTGAQEGYHDDRVVAIALAWAIREDCPPIHYFDPPPVRRPFKMRTLSAMFLDRSFLLRNK